VPLPRGSAIETLMFIFDKTYFRHFVASSVSHVFAMKTYLQCKSQKQQTLFPKLTIAFSVAQLITQNKFLVQSNAVLNL